MQCELPAISEDVFSKCQVATPRIIASFMLDLAEYNNNIIYKQALEYSFGDGDIILMMAERYILDAYAHGMNEREIAAGLGHDLTGIEIDDDKLPRVQSKLDALAAGYGIMNVCWDLRCEDALMMKEEEKYDFIIGNPPYLESKAIRLDVREYLRVHFESCAWGKFDYCYAFVEKAKLLLNDVGNMVHIIPSSVLKNRSAQALRHMLLEGITDIVTFPTGNVFQNVIVSPCIVRYSKAAAGDWINLSLWQGEPNARTSDRVKKDDWAAGKIGESRANTRFGDKYHAFMPVATLCNDAFIISDLEDIECGIVRRAASPRQLRARRDRRIIFPYTSNDDGSVKRIDKTTFETEYPKAYAHLAEFRDRLDGRNADKKAEWYEYGRSQCLSRLGRNEMLLMSTVVSERVVLYELDKRVIPYGGIVITAKNGARLDDAKRILQSSDFMRYVREAGTTINGSSVRITCRIINQFRYNSESEVPS